MYTHTPTREQMCARATEENEILTHAHNETAKADRTLVQYQHQFLVEYMSLHPTSWAAPE